MPGRALLQGLGAAVLIVVAAIAFTPLANVLAGWISVTPQVGPADAIVVLGGGSEWPGGEMSSTALHRTARGITLHRYGLAPLLAFSGAPGRFPPSLSEIEGAFARQCGVPAAAIVTDDRSYTTREEARHLAERLQPLGVRSILLVSDSHHLVRARRAFERQGFRVLPVPANDGPEPARAPAARFALMNRAVQEILAVAYYRLAGWI